MYQYKLPAGLPAGSRAAWSRLLLQPLSADLLTPFSYSVLAEVAGRAWFAYYDRLGFDPMPRPRFVRRHEGRAYANLALSAQREAEAAAVEPIAFALDGSPFPIARVEERGLLAGFKAGRAARAIERTREALAAEMPALTAAARAWLDHVRAMRWTQAEILMVMEEIEPVTTPPFVPFLAARQAVLRGVVRLVRLAGQPASETVRQIDRGLGAASTVEAEIARRLQRLAPRATAGLRGWQDSGSAEEARARLAGLGLGDDLDAFLADYGHRSLAIGELAEARWSEDPSPILRALQNPPPSIPARDEHAVSVLLAAVDVKERKAAQETIDVLRAAVPLQSQALDALAYQMAGTRLWAGGAAREALSDARIADAESIFFYELEEIKQMMTGEWNISDRQQIQALAEERRAQTAGWRTLHAADLLIGDTPAEALDRTEPSTVLDPTLFYAAAMRPRTSSPLGVPAQGAAETLSSAESGTASS